MRAEGWNKSVHNWHTMRKGELAWACNTKRPQERRVCDISCCQGEREREREREGGGGAFALSPLCLAPSFPLFYVWPLSALGRELKREYDCE
jgi:hypothetical protein